MPKKMEFSIVVPVYNSEASLYELYSRTKKTFEKTDDAFEMILVDDGSRDKSWKVLEKLHSRDKRIKIIQLIRNFGQHNALICGLGYATGDFAITIDDDLQHPPEEIPKLIAEIRKGYDVVYGQYIRKEHGFGRNFGTDFINYILRKVTYRNFNLTSFRIIRKVVVDKMVKHHNFTVNIDVCISNLVTNEKVGLTLVKHQKRKFGKTNYSLRKLIAFTINLILNFSTFPLQIASVMGLSFSFLSFLAAIGLLADHFFLHKVFLPGWTSLILIVIFFSGLILFVLGIIGEYISRIFLSFNNKPQFEIREVKLK